MVLIFNAIAIGGNGGDRDVSRSALAVEINGVIYCIYVPATKVAKQISEAKSGVLDCKQKIYYLAAIQSRIT